MESKRGSQGSRRDAETQVRASRTADYASLKSEKMGPAELFALK